MKFSIVCLSVTCAQTFDRYITTRSGENCRDACLEELECDCYDYNHDNEVCRFKVYRDRTIFVEFLAKKNRKFSSNIDHN